MNNRKFTSLINHVEHIHSVSTTYMYNAYTCIYRQWNNVYWFTHKPCIHTIKLNSSNSSPNKYCRNVPLPTRDDLQFNCSGPNRHTLFWVHTFTSTLQIGQVAFVWKIKVYSFNSNKFQSHTIVLKFHAYLTIIIIYNYWVELIA